MPPRKNVITCDAVSGSRRVALAFPRSHLPDDQRASLDLPLNLLQLRTALLSPTSSDKAINPGRAAPTGPKTISHALCRRFAFAAQRRALASRPLR
jgi:hypothetical protein